MVALRELGVGAEAEVGVAPLQKSDVMGAVLGRSVINWPRSGSTILPGAICDNLTSFGGILKSDATQTPLTDFLRFGAAGSSGTVVEPFSLQAKFPHPWMHVHYARGATLAEAFYQSVAAPYQLLIVGDPLCRPWARSPQVQVDGLPSGNTVQGKLALTPRSSPDSTPREYQCFLDGRFRFSTRPGQTFEFDTAKLPDGYHELRVVAIEDSALESQGRAILPLHVDNRGNLIEWNLQPGTISSKQVAQLTVKSSGAKSIFLYHERQPLGQVDRAEGQFTIDPQTVGRGPVTLTAVAINGENNQRIVSAPSSSWCGTGRRSDAADRVGARDGRGLHAVGAGGGSAGIGRRGGTRRGDRRA